MTNTECGGIAVSGTVCTQNCPYNDLGDSNAYCTTSCELGGIVVETCSSTMTNPTTYCNSQCTYDNDNVMTCSQTCTTLAGNTGACDTTGMLAPTTCSATCSDTLVSCACSCSYNWDNSIYCGPTVTPVATYTSNWKKDTSVNLMLYPNTYSVSHPAVYDTDGVTIITAAWVE